MKVNGDSNYNNCDAGPKFDCFQTRITRFVKKCSSEKQIINAAHTKNPPSRESRFVSLLVHRVIIA